MANQHMAGDRSARVTVLGLGPMGRALAGAFLHGGQATTVWNRTAAKAEPVVARGAVQAGTVAEAVAAGPLVIVCVIDYAAVRAIVTPAAGALKGRTLVNLTAGAPQDARELAAWCGERGIGYIDGAIMTPTTSIGGPDAVLFYSGPEHLYRDHQPALAALGGTAAYLGADHGRAAAHEVALLDLFWTSMSGLIHAFALAAAENITARELAPYAQGIAKLLPEIALQFADQIDGGHHPGDDSTILSAAAGMRHIIDTTRSHGIDATVLSAAAAIAQRAIDAGHGADGFSRLTRILAEPRARS